MSMHPLGVLENIYIIELFSWHTISLILLTLPEVSESTDTL